MVTIIPFKALRPGAQHAKQVASKPYDVLSSREAKIEAQGNPISFLHITKSEIDLPENLSPYAPEVYDKAKENLVAFKSREILFLENKPCYYIYRLVMPAIGNIGKEHTQTGLVCCSSLKDYDSGYIKKHEYTRPDKELDRINHIKITGAQTGNVFLAYKNIEDIDIIIAQWKTERSPVYDFIADDMIRHSIWIINDGDIISKITSIFKNKVPCSYIADGHHRAASAAKARQYFDSKESGFFLTTLFPSNQLQILDYNRVIKDLNGINPHDLLKEIREKFTVEKKDKAISPSEQHTFGMYLEHQWYHLAAKENIINKDPMGVLDITILQNNILEPLLGISDQRTDKRIDFVGGIRGVTELENRVDQGDAVAFSLYPVSIEQLFNIADSGDVMPPKSTWFEPKLRDGLLTNLIN